MIKIFKTTDSGVLQISEFEDNSWISMTNPTTVINTIIPTKQPKINVKRLKNNPKLIFGKNCKKPQKISTKIYRRIYIG